MAAQFLPALLRILGSVGGRAAASGGGRATAGAAAKEGGKKAASGASADLGTNIMDALSAFAMGSGGGSKGGSGESGSASGSPDDGKNKFQKFAESPIGDFAIDKSIDFLLNQRLASAFKDSRPQDPTKRDLSSDAFGETQAGISKEWMGRTNRAFQNTKDMAFSINPFEKGRAMADSVKMMAEFPFVIERWGESLKESQKTLKDWNAQLARTFAESDVREAERKMGSAERTAGSTSDMVESLDNLKDSFQPYRDVGTNISNRLTEMGARIVDGLINTVETLTAIDKGIQIVNDVLSGGEADRNGTLFEQFRNDITESLSKKGYSFVPTLPAKEKE